MSVGAWRHSDQIGKITVEYGGDDANGYQVTQQFDLKVGHLNVISVNINHDSPSVINSIEDFNNKYPLEFIELVRNPVNVGDIYEVKLDHLPLYRSTDVQLKQNPSYTKKDTTKVTHFIERNVGSRIKWENVVFVLVCIIIIMAVVIYFK